MDRSLEEINVEKVLDTIIQIYKKTKSNKKQSVCRKKEYSECIDMLQKELCPDVFQKIQKSFSGVEDISLELSKRKEAFEKKKVDSEIRRMLLENESNLKASSTSKKNNANTKPTASRSWENIAKKAAQAARKISIRAQITRKISQACIKKVERNQQSIEKSSKEASVRSKRLLKEVQVFWKKYERFQKEEKKREGRKDAERRKQLEEQEENERQKKKLEFLLTQSELYTHFVTKKIGADQIEDTEEGKIAFEAVQKNQSRIDCYEKPESESKDIEKEEEIQTPSILDCQLKNYQLKGLSWLAGLYERGINGILADEMGLGKTVQAIGLMAHIAEKKGIYGPFLVITPASTLHNWQQEFVRFLPSFKMIPYWGSIADRKTLRQSWRKTELGKKESQFHVCVTSYQLVVTDRAYFQKVKWHYMVLDEAQAIKSTTGLRWKTLLGFSCRNRLLLTGTPIQNSMQELWALLHFIMPTLFDSHSEFSEWFSKDIESHAEEKTALDQKILLRLHMILKPFMLRRMKSEVASEMVKKIEIDVYCKPSPVQKRMYSSIRRNIPVETLNLKGSETERSKRLMNIVMQLRKVCNHPELFTRHEVTQPLILNSMESIPDTPETRLYSEKRPWITKNFQEIPEIKREKVPSVFQIKKPNDIPVFNIENKTFCLTKKEFPISKIIVPRVIAPPLKRGKTQFLIDRDGNIKETLKKYSSTEKGIESFIIPPDHTKLISDSGKILYLEQLLTELYKKGHRVLIYFQMTRMINLFEEYLKNRPYRYLRFDGSSKISDRRDMVADWQSNPNIFIFLLSTRAGGIGINLTSADTVIFYDSDWNPTVDQQAMDRAHRLGQTKDVTVYRLLMKDTIEERIQLRAKQKNRMQNVVISGNVTSDLKSQEIASLLLEEND
eukprot:GHVP01053255.1.p1 GENE.GHVP01053255.1~~GHVP01053255.1.p1  ORF type:complete len:898 (+),score=190.49 GHVP01053255.1:3-2696(+)